MKISRRAEYAVQAVLDLALHGQGSGGIRSAEIARRTKVPEKFLDAILLDLRKAGIVGSKRGPDGGHWLARDPARLSVATILTAIDGAASIAAPVPRRRGTPAEVCIEGLWASVADAARAVTDKVTVEELRRRVGDGGTLDYSI
jgi:Rrf2 family protein